MSCQVLSLPLFQQLIHQNSVAICYLRATCTTHCQHCAFSLLHTWWLQYHHRGLLHYSQGTVPQPDQLGSAVRGEVHRPAGGLPLQPSPWRSSKCPAPDWLQRRSPHCRACCQLSQQRQTRKDHWWERIFGFISAFSDILKCTESRGEPTKCLDTKFS